MSFSVHPGEHPPPHFTVYYNGETASFEILTGKRLAGQKGLEKEEKKIQKCYKENRCLIIKDWNRTRPSDCPVGKVDVPPECE